MKIQIWIVIQESNFFEPQDKRVQFGLSIFGFVFILQRRYRSILIWPVSIRCAT